MFSELCKYRHYIVHRHAIDYVSALEVLLCLERVVLCSGF